MYIRFTTTENDNRSGKPKGIFTLAYELIDEESLYAEDEKTLKELLGWFGDNLPVPTKFSKNRNDYHKNTLGISWLKPQSTKVVNKFWGLKSILEIAGYHIEVIKTDRPGKIVYEDLHQLVAVPFGGEKF